jgi:hypothetical protein
MPPPTEPSVSESTPTSTSQAPTIDSWRDDYSDDELAAYHAALARWTEYETRAAPIWEAGKATPEAQALFRQYFPAPNWQAQFQTLETYEQAEVRVTGLPTVKWSEATRIKTGGSTGSVSIRQCVDYLTAQIRQYGQPVEKEAVFQQPVLRTIVLGKPEGKSWLIYQLREPTAKDAKNCDPETAP